MKKQNRKNESGRSLIEMLGVLTLMGLLSAVAFVLVRSGMTSQKVARTGDEIGMLVANVRNIAVEKGDFSNLPECDSLTETADSKKLASALLDSGADEYTTPMGGVFAVCKVNTNVNEFWVYIDAGTSVDALSQDDCRMMEMRAYAGGTATCDGTTLKIKYTKYDAQDVTE